MNRGDEDGRDGMGVGEEREVLGVGVVVGRVLLMDSGLSKGLGKNGVKTGKGVVEVWGLVERNGERD